MTDFTTVSGYMASTAGIVACIFFTVFLLKDGLNTNAAIALAVCCFCSTIGSLITPVDPNKKV
jgi:hypothetical protein